MGKPTPPASAAKEPAAKAPKSVSKVTINLRGLEYGVACGAGEEKKLAELVTFVNGKLDEVAAGAAGANTSEMRLFMLTCLMMADELIETRKILKETRKADEDLMIAAVEHLTDRVATITAHIGRA